MPIIKEESSRKWEIVFVDCIEPGGVSAVMTRFEVTSPDGKTRSVRPAFTMEYVDDYFRIPGDENITSRRSAIIKEKEPLFKLWGLIRIEELIDRGALEAEPKISSQNFEWAKKIEEGKLLPSSKQQTDNIYFYIAEQEIGMIFDAKSPFDLSLSEVKSIIGLEESQELEFKGTAYQYTKKPENEWKLELLKDVTSFANAHGGYLFIGVTDANDKASGFNNIEKAQSISEGIFSICHRYIDEKLSADEMVIATRRIDEVTEIIIIRILPGRKKPYMIIFNDNTLFYKRHGKRIMLMSIGEIRDAIKGDEDSLRLKKIEKMLEHLVR